jgi:hypothetical protein
MIGQTITVMAEAGLAGLATATQTGKAEVLGPGAVPLALTVNGRSRTVLADPATTLVEALRLGLDMTGRTWRARPPAPPWPARRRSRAISTRCRCWRRSCGARSSPPPPPSSVTGFLKRSFYG